MNRIKFLVSLCIAISLNTQAQDIWETTCKGNLERLDSLLSDNTNINVQNGGRSSLLHKAIECQQVEYFDFLIDRGIDIKSKNYQGTALTLSIRSKNETFFNRLIKLHSNREITEEYRGLLSHTIGANNKTAFSFQAVERVRLTYIGWIHK